MSLDGRLERRAFIKTTTAAAGGLLIGLYLPRGASESIVEAQFGPPAAITPNAFIRIGTDDVVTLIIHKPDNGQGTETSLAMLLAEELECDWSRIRTEFAPINPIYGGALQGTFGSLAIRTSYDPMRRTGAAAREMLVQAAAQRWGVATSQCRAENGVVVNTATNARLTYGSLAEAASKLPVPSTITLKDPSQFRLIGKPMKRVDTPAKVTGRATFGIDVRLPDMVYAVVARCPVFGGKVARFDATRAKAVGGVTQVIQIPQGIAVVATNTWAAMEGRRALQVEWDEGPNAALNTAGIRELFANLTLKPGAVAEDHGQAAAALASAARRVEAAYEAPYLAHARIEPYACVAQVRGGSCDVWTGTQIPGQAHGTAVAASGLPPASVKRAHHLHGRQLWQPRRRRVRRRSGGNRQSRRRAGEPHLLARRRAAARLYRPASHVRFAAGLDADGWPIAWTARIACPTWMACATASRARASKGSPSTTSPTSVEYHDPGIGIPTGYWRSVGLSQNTFFAESFVDELAAAGGQGSGELRRRLFAKSPRLLAVLDLAAEKAGWGTPFPAGASAASPRSPGSAASTRRSPRSRSTRAGSASIAWSAPSTAGKSSILGVVAAGGGRDGLRIERRAPRQHHDRSRSRRAAELPPVPAAADPRDAGGGGAHRSEHRRAWRHRRGVDAGRSAAVANAISPPPASGSAGCPSAWRSWRDGTRDRKTKYTAPIRQSAAHR